MKFIFIDESGEPGFCQTSPTTHFILSLLIFDSVENLHKCENALTDLKRELCFKTEFKFVKSYSKIRDKFFELIKPLNFRVKAICVEKVAITSNFLRTNPKKFYTKQQ